MSNDDDVLKNWAPGGILWLYRTFRAGCDCIPLTVVRQTAKQVIMSNGKRYWRRNGLQVGSTLNSTELCADRPRGVPVGQDGSPQDYFAAGIEIPERYTDSLRAAAEALAKATGE